MCLINVTADTPTIAGRDIICYKAVRISSSLKDIAIKSGEDCLATICYGNKKVQVEGKILISFSGVFLIHNNKNPDLSLYNLSHDEKCSIRLDSDTSSLIINEVEHIKSMYTTPFQDFEVEIGREYKSELQKIYRCAGMVGRGLHSYARKPRIADKGCIIAKCIIPKGSKYYKGTFRGRVSYASDTIRYVRLLDSTKS